MSNAGTDNIEIVRANADQIRDARSLVWHGALLCGLGLLSGFTTIFAASPRTALSAHTIGVIEGAVLFGLAGAWPLLQGSLRTLRIAKYTLLVGLYANWIGVQIAAFWSAGRAMFIVNGPDMPEGGSAISNAMVAILLNASALVLITCGIVLWSARSAKRGER